MEALTRAGDRRGWGRDSGDRAVRAALSLRAVAGLGDRGIRREVEGRGSVEAAARAHGLDTRRARRVLADVRARGLGGLVIGTPGYPAPLYDLIDPPPILFAPPGAWPDPARSVAIVGTRGSSGNGDRVAYEIARGLGRRGWAIVSGMAVGIDASAHAGALDAGAATVGVLGSGHAHEYPRANRALYRRMRRHGLLVSEFTPVEKPSRMTFPRRNRLIAALTRVTIVVEAGERSGALITADHALDLGREVFAAPGRPNDPKSVGTLRLIRQGAVMVRHAVDVLDSLGEVSAPLSESDPSLSATGRDAAVIRALAADDLTPDEIARRAAMPVSEALAALGRLELDGLVSRRRAGRYATAPGAGVR